VDLPPQLLAQTALEEIAEPGSGWVIGEFAVALTSPGMSLGGKAECPQSRVKCSPTPTSGSRVRGRRFLTGGFIHHQAAVVKCPRVGADDGLLMRPNGQVVGVNDQAAGLDLTWRPKRP